MFRDPSSKKGFSLIELMVVIGIIGILASAIMASMSKARKKGRDTNRLSSMLQLQVALEAYRNLNGVYPPTCSPGGTPRLWSGAHLGFGECVSNYIVGLAPSYIGSLPIDPSGPATTYGIVYMEANDGKDYKVMVYGSLEGVSNMAAGMEHAICPSSCDAGLYPKCYSDVNAPRTYAVYTPAVACITP